MRSKRNRSEIAQLKQANAKLHDELAFNKRLATGVRDGLWHRHLKKDELWVCPRWWQSLGYTEEELPHSFTALSALIHPDDLKLVESSVNAHLQRTTDEYECTFRLRNKMGKYRSILSRGIRFPHGDQEAKYLVGSHADITEFMQRSEKDKARFAMFELIFKSIPHLIVVKNRAGKFLFANQALADFYGAESPEDLIGKCDADFNHNEKQVEIFLKDDCEVIDTRQTKNIAKEINTDFEGKSHWLTTIKVPLVNSDGTVDVVIVATFIDKIIALNEAAEIAKRLTHKLNTRVATIESFVEVMPCQDKDKVDVTAAIEDVKQFTEDFKSLNLANQVKFEPTNIIAILHGGLNAFIHKATITINGTLLEKYPENNEFRLIADKTKLEHVFTELASNSLKYKRLSQHCIKITIKPFFEKPVFFVPNSHAPTKLKITFQDNGQGVDETLSKTLFEPFVSGDFDEGTGLGLAIVDEVVKSHNGTIVENGKFGDGACFEIIIPINPIKK